MGMYITCTGSSSQKNTLTLTRSGTYGNHSYDFTVTGGTNRTYYSLKTPTGTYSWNLKTASNKTIMAGTYTATTSGADKAIDVTFDISNTSSPGNPDEPSMISRTIEDEDLNISIAFVTEENSTNTQSIDDIESL